MEFPDKPSFKSYTKKDENKRLKLLIESMRDKPYVAKDKTPSSVNQGV